MKDLALVSLVAIPVLLLSLPIFVLLKWIRPRLFHESMRRIVWIHVGVAVFGALVGGLALWSDRPPRSKGQDTPAVSPQTSAPSESSPQPVVPTEAARNAFLEYMDEWLAATKLFDGQIRSIMEGVDRLGRGEIDTNTFYETVLYHPNYRRHLCIRTFETGSVPAELAGIEPQINKAVGGWWSLCTELKIFVQTFREWIDDPRPSKHEKVLFWLQEIGTKKSQYYGETLRQLTAIGQELGLSNAEIQRVMSHQ